MVFGAGLGSAAQSSEGLTSTLGGSSIQIVDTSGKASSALPYYTSPAQMNFLMPSNLRPGMATLTVSNQSGISNTAQIMVSAVSPGIFSADATGTGVAAGSAVRVSADGTKRNCRSAIAAVRRWFASRFRSIWAAQRTRFIFRCTEPAYEGEAR